MSQFFLVKAGFTLLELLMACAVVAVLVAVVIPVSSKISRYALRTKSISNLRQIGVAAHLYASEHNQQLPGQPGNGGLLQPSNTQDQWPTLFCAYLTPSDPTVFLDPTDPTTSKLPLTAILANTSNNTGYVYNGFDDLAANNQPPSTVSLTTLATPSEIVLLAQKTPGATTFFVSPIFQPVASLFSLLNPAAYDGGSHYLFVDGSVRFIKQTDYSNTFWLVDKTTTLPFPPLLPPPSGLPPAPPHDDQLAMFTF